MEIESLMKEGNFLLGDKPRCSVWPKFRGHPMAQCLLYMIDRK